MRGLGRGGGAALTRAEWFSPASLLGAAPPPRPRRRAEPLRALSPWRARGYHFLLMLAVVQAI